MIILSPLTVRSAQFDKAINTANIVCSRESTYRVALDVSGFEMPTVAGDILSFRGWKKIIESTLEGLAAAISIGLAPQITSIVAKIIGRFILPEELQKHTLNLLKFSRYELDDLDSFRNGVDRVRLEESEDKRFIASLYKKNKNTKTADKYENEAKKIEDFCNELSSNITETTRKYAHKMKKASIIAQSTIEGAWWGSWGIILRAIRKHILKADSYTGTMSYADEGGDGEMKWWQKAIGIGCIGVSPITNILLFNKSDKKEDVEKSKFLNSLKNNLDMTHGVYPKLGLLFSITSYPKWIGVICQSQGPSELVERLLTLGTVLPSWWMGHRITNGVFAKSADKSIKEKYKIPGGILVENEYLKSNNFFSRNMPEPAKIHHVLNEARKQGGELSPEKKEELVNEVEEQHAKSLGKGFLAHSAGIWLIKMAINQLVKIFTLWRLGTRF